MKTVDQLPKRLLQQKEKHSLKWEDVEKAHIEKVLKHFNYNQCQSLKALGYKSINTLKKRIKEYNIDIPEEFQRRRKAKADY